MPLSMKPVESNRRNGPSGSNLKKSQKLLLLSEGIPDFPLSEQTIASVAHLPGELPASLEEFLEILRVDSSRMPA